MIQTPSFRIDTAWRLPLALLTINMLLGLGLTGAAGWRLPDGRDPQRPTQQLHPATIEWLVAPPPKPRPAALAKPAPSSPPVPAAPPPAARVSRDSSDGVAASHAANPPAAALPSNASNGADKNPFAPVAATLRCLEWGSFSSDEIDIAEAAMRDGLAALPVPSRKPALSRRAAVEPSSWVVYLPSQEGLQTASTNAATLRDMGITDFYVLQEEGPLRFALSLGVFRNAESAQRHVAALETRGVRGAQIHARVPTNSRHWLRIGNLEETLAGPLRAKLGAQTSAAFKGRTWRRCG